MQGNSGETQKILVEAYKSAGKLGANSGETQKNIFEAYKSVQGNSGETQNIQGSWGKVKNQICPCTTVLSLKD